MKIYRPQAIRKICFHGKKKIVKTKVEPKNFGEEKVTPKVSRKKKVFVVERKSYPERSSAEKIVNDKQLFLY